MVGHIKNHLRMNMVVINRPGTYACLAIYLGEAETPLDAKGIWCDLMGVSKAAWLSKAIVAAFAHFEDKVKNITHQRSKETQMMVQ